MSAAESIGGYLLDGLALVVIAAALSLSVLVLVFVIVKVVKYAWIGTW